MHRRNPYLDIKKLRTRPNHLSPAAPKGNPVKSAKVVIAPKGVSTKTSAFGSPLHTEHCAQDELPKRFPNSYEMPIVCSNDHCDYEDHNTPAELALEEKAHLALATKRDTVLNQLGTILDLFYYNKTKKFSRKHQYIHSASIRSGKYSSKMKPSNYLKKLAERADLTVETLLLGYHYMTTLPEGRCLPNVSFDCFIATNMLLAHKFEDDNSQDDNNKFSSNVGVPAKSLTECEAVLLKLHDYRLFNLQTQGGSTRAFWSSILITLEKDHKDLTTVSESKEQKNTAIVTTSTFSHKPPLHPPTIEKADSKKPKTSEVSSSTTELKNALLQKREIVLINVGAILDFHFFNNSSINIKHQKFLALAANNSCSQITTKISPSDYLRKLATELKFSVQTLLLGYQYMTSLQEDRTPPNGFALDNLIAVCLLLAVKFYDARYLGENSQRLNERFATVAGFSLNQLDRLSREFPDSNSFAVFNRHAHKANTQTFWSDALRSLENDSNSLAQLQQKTSAASSLSNRKK